MMMMMMVVGMKTIKIIITSSGLVLCLYAREIFVRLPTPSHYMTIQSIRTRRDAEEKRLANGLGLLLSSSSSSSNDRMRSIKEDREEHII